MVEDFGNVDGAEGTGASGGSGVGAGASRGARLKQTARVATAAARTAIRGGKIFFFIKENRSESLDYIRRLRLYYQQVSLYIMVWGYFPFSDNKKKIIELC